MTQWGIDTLFNPGKRHMDEEKRRLQSTREEVGDSSGGKRIDLDGGKVRLAGRPDKDATDEEAAADVTERDAAEDGEAAEITQADAEPAEEAEDSPAARARRRRRNA